MNNWCQHDYAEYHTRIAEWADTWSSLSFFITGVVAIRVAIKHDLPFPYRMAGFRIISMGAFFFIFHTFLRFQRNMDESFDMVLISGMGYRCLIGIITVLV